jgi:signal transduction histidine kinase
MREIRLSGSVEGVVSNHDPYSDSLVFSVWVSFILPREVIHPLVSLKEAVDHAATGNYEVEFELHGGGEVMELAKSVQNLSSLLRRKA